MVLWIAMALMTGAAVLAALYPLSRPCRAEDDEGGDVQFYRDQIGEIARDVARGGLSPAEAVGARAEAGRRLLRARGGPEHPVPATGEPALRRRRAASAFALSVVPLVALAVYGALGSPRYAEAVVSQPEIAGEAAKLQAAVVQVEAHLRTKPDDLRGWELIAPIYLRVGRFDEAATAYAHALRLGGDTPDRLVNYGEAVVSGANGTVGPDALAAFRKALAIEPGSAKARFFVGLGAEQGGDAAGARAEYEAILRSSAPDTPWVPLVRSKVEALAGGQASGGQKLVPGAFDPAINAMVSSLDGRLRTSGGSEPEWGRLVRSYVVLGQRDEALDRLRRARIALAGDPGAGPRLDQLASDLGLTEGAGR